jgi:asparagine synthase (glutamine-hydrolysing)
VRELANVFALDWTASSLAPPLGKDILHLLRRKNGLNNLGMSFILPFFNLVRQKFGSNIQYWTGDGGDKLLPDLTPAMAFKNTDELVHHVVSTNYEFSLESVVALTGIAKHDILDEIHQIFLQYPENILQQKYVHFLIFERAFKRLFEGEDRNRCYFWSISPFYSIDFFRYAMECPDEQKAKYVLYRNFLTKLSPHAAKIKSTHWGMPITSQRYQMWLFARATIVSKIPRSLRKALKPTPNYPGVVRYRELINAQHKHCTAIKQHFSPPNFEALLKKCTRTQAEFLLTITSFMEYAENGRSTLEQYWNCEF